jgi:hypothetical protein
VGVEKVANYVSGQLRGWGTYTLLISDIGMVMEVSVANGGARYACPTGRGLPLPAIHK